MGAHWIEPVVLEGTVARLEPLGREHVDGLWEAGQDESIWTWMPWRMKERADMEAVVMGQVEMTRDGSGQGFAVLHRATGRVCGATAYLNVAAWARRLEIGATWLGPVWQRTGVNTDAKATLLTHAFEVLGANRVEFKTDAANQRSRSALLRIGAVEEGTLRHHMVRPDGSRRDSVYFSVIAEEWPSVRDRLNGLLRHGGVVVPKPGE
jgi:RimJ/RimL family protein N-acetyltransferase